MGHQIIRQPDGKLAVFSSIVDAWILMDATPADLEDYYAEKAAEDARQRTRKVLEHVLAGEPRKAYYQFAMTFDEANDKSRETGERGEPGAEWWSDGEWVSQSPKPG